MRQESACGILVVLAFTSVLVFLTTNYALKDNVLPSGVWWTCAVLIYGEAAIALTCLCGILLGNPGEVPRSEENCFPVPAEVASSPASRCMASNSLALALKSTLEGCCGQQKASAQLPQHPWWYRHAVLTHCLSGTARNK